MLKLYNIYIVVVVVCIYITQSAVSSKQYTFLTYPDPRIDPLSCGIKSPGHLCDPNGIIPIIERNEVSATIDKLIKEAAYIQNKSPACESSVNSKIEIMVALVTKIGTLSTATDIEKFANSLKGRYQKLKDPNDCDNIILIVNSKKDRQVYTVAGRDVKLTKDILKNAFEENIHNFKKAAFAKGLLGMVKYLINSYKIIHGAEDEQLPESLFGPNPEIPQLTIDGVQTNEGDFLPKDKVQTEISPSLISNNIVEKPENDSDKLWVDILQQAVGRCDGQGDRIGLYVQAIVEEAMSLSLRLIRDTRYTQIEESIQNVVNIENGKNRVWQEATEAFIEDLYMKYAAYIKSGSSARKCPARVPHMNIIKRR